MVKKTDRDIGVAAPETSTTSRGRVYGGVAAAARIADRRPRLIAAGLELFGTLGYSRTTVRGICKASGLTDRYFYESFDSTEDLLCAVYEHVMGEIWREIDAIQAREGSVDFAEQTKAGLVVYFNHIRDPLRARILLATIVGVSRRLDGLYQAHMKRFAAHLLNRYWISVGKTRKATQVESLMGTAFVGAVLMVATEWAQGGYKQSRATAVTACLNVILGACAAI